MATRGDSGGGQYTYLVVKHNSICEESKEPREGFEPVEVFNPKTKETLTKYIDKWGSVSGFVNNLEYYDREHNGTKFQGVKINIDDEVVLDLAAKTPAYDTFCKLAENIDFTQEVTFKAGLDKKNERTAFFVTQGNEGVKWKYTKDNPGDCPPWEKDEDGEWDSRKQRAFLKKRIIDVVIPAATAAASERAGETATEAAPEVEETKSSAATAGAKNSKAGKKTAPAPVETDDIPF
jgi:hypothetical protein